MHLTTAGAMRRADGAAIAGGIPSVLLMRRASEHLARAALELCGEEALYYVFCGSGNNGGDGVGAAAYLLRRGCRARAFLVGSRERMTADTAEMERRLREAGGALEDYAPGMALETPGGVIDAIFGVGLSRELGGAALEAVHYINSCPCPVVAADIPSGVEADTGRVLGAAVRADVTVTFSMAKIGHYVEPGCVHCGAVRICGIGIPEGILAGCESGVDVIEPPRFPKRDPLSHKGDYGKLLLVGGSVGYTGAPSLCARAAVRSGAGLVYLGVPESIYPVTAVKNDEAMPFPLPSENGGLSAEALPALLERLQGCDLCAIGPGLGRGTGAAQVVRGLLRESGKPLVLDADALYALSLDMDALRRSKAPVYLTPHEGEFVRMGGVLSGDRVSDARSFAEKYHCTLILKGHRTLIARPDGRVSVTPCGNPGMAKGGCGDVLTGILAALLGQGLPAEAAVYLHSYAGDLCRDNYGEYAMTASDLIGTLPQALRNLSE